MSSHPSSRSPGDVSAVVPPSADVLAKLRLLECLDHLHRALGTNPDLEVAVGAALGVFLTEFDCDRVALVRPVRSQSSMWSAEFERHRPLVPSLHELADWTPVSTGQMSMPALLLDLNTPVALGHSGAMAIPAELAERFQIRSALALPLQPRQGRPFLLVLQECHQDRVWTPAEHTLLHEMGARLNDALALLHGYRALRDSRARLAAAQRLSHIGHWERDFLADTIHFSSEARRIYGLGLDEETPNLQDWNKRWLTHLHPDDRDRVLADQARAVHEGISVQTTYRLVFADRGERWLEVIVEPIHDSKGRVVRLFGSAQDITDRMQAQRDLRESEARFRLYSEAAPDGFLLLDEQMRFLDCNARLVEMLGYSREELQGITPEFALPWISTELKEDIQRAVDEGTRSTRTTTLRHRDGHPIPAEMNICGHVNHERRLTVLYLRDISERLAMEETLRQSHFFLKQLLEGSRDPVYSKDSKGRYTLINAVGARLLGLPPEDILGKDDRTLLGEEAGGIVGVQDQLVLQTGEPQYSTEEFQIAGQRHVFLSAKSPIHDAQGNIAGLIGISHDVTNLRRLEDQLAQAQRLEAIGRLAGGIAHDFNNLLTVINGYSQMALDDMGENDPNQPRIANVLRCGERAAALTRQLLAFGRRQVLQPRAVSVPDTMAHLRDILARLLGEDIDLRLFHSPDDGCVLVDPSQFEQAIVNLAVNARDAMPEGGTLTMDSRIVLLGLDDPRRPAALHAGRYVEIAFSDTGTGMSPELVSHIFEPFFTTKAGDKGTGLGLAMVHGFVSQSGGDIQVQSIVGRGTTFRILLPVVPGPAEKETFPRPETHALQGHETVLLVEDEGPVRDLLRSSLVAFGYRVIESTDGADAVQRIQDTTELFDAIVTDMVMPRLRGRQVLEAVARSRPGTPVVAMSGYPGESMLPQHIEGQPFEFLQKPFQPAELAQCLRRMLDERASRSA